MQENIVAEIKISHSPTQLIEAFFGCFAPDIQAVRLRMLSDETTTREVVFEDVYAWQPDLLPILRAQCLDFYPADQESYPFSTQEVIISVKLQLLAQEHDRNSCPLPKLLIFSAAEGANAILDFGHPGCYEAGVILSKSGCLLDQAFILKALKHVCYKASLDFLYLMNQERDFLPWNHSFLFYRFPIRYFQDLIKLKYWWMDFERDKTSTLFRGHTAQQAEELHQFVANHSAIFWGFNRSFAVPSVDDLAAIWQQTQSHSGVSSNFDYFITEAGIGLFTNNLFDTYCYQPYLALIEYVFKYFYPAKAALSPTDIGVENVPAPSDDEIYGKPAEEKKPTPSVQAHPTPIPSAPEEADESSPDSQTSTMLATG